MLVLIGAFLHGKYVTTVYVIADEIIRILNIQDDTQSVMSSSEIITFAIVRAKFFAGNYKIARYMCQKMGLLATVD